MTLKSILFLLCLGFLTSTSCQQSAGSMQVKVKFSDALKSDIKKEGRLFVFLNENPRAEPRTQIWPSAGNYIFAKNFTNVSAGQEMLISDVSDWTKTPEWSLSNVPPGDYYVQVLWDQDQEESRINAPGNLYGDKKKMTITGPLTLDFTIDKVIAKTELVNHELLKEVNYESASLSKFWGKPMFVKAAVLLPHGYTAGKAYPIRYNVAGYGGRYTRVNRLVGRKQFMDWWTSGEAPEVITVYLDGEGPFGDSYQMDSDNSGPYGENLINELIPHIEKQYRGTEDMKTRFVDGCSTGGWVSLGLQMYYPDVFNGVFSYSPDAVAFENYQLINIYKDKNAYTNEHGYSRPVMRSVDGEPMMSLKEFINYENVLGASDSYLNSGGQFSAHTALYSGKGKNGLPKPLFDPITGNMDSDVAKSWEKYDFKKHADKNWTTLGPKLQDKIYIWMGDMDNFYLNPATRQLDAFFESTTSPKSNAVVEFSPMQGHCQAFSDKRILEQVQVRLTQLK